MKANGEVIVCSKLEEESKLHQHSHSPFNKEMIRQIQEENVVAVLDTSVKDGKIGGNQIVIDNN